MRITDIGAVIGSSKLLRNGVPAHRFVYCFTVNRVLIYFGDGGRDTLRRRRGRQGYELSYMEGFDA